MIRLMKLDDYDELLALWQSIDGMGMRSLDDSRQGIERFLKRNPNTCFVHEVDEKIVGAILSGHDGRRGYIYHAAVHQDFRNKKIGKGLVDSALKALKVEGINKAALVVFKDNALGNNFWEQYGFFKRSDLNYRNMSINSDNQ